MNTLIHFLFNDVVKISDFTASKVANEIKSMRNCCVNMDKVIIALRIFSWIARFGVGDLKSV